MWWWLWGDLHPIPRQLSLDLVLLAALTYTTFLGSPSTKGFVISAVVLGLHLFYSGWTCRWPLTVACFPVFFLQSWRISLWMMQGQSMATSSIWTVWTLLGLVFIGLGAALSILFPAVELPRVQGPYQVGMVEFFLPVPNQYTAATPFASSSPKTSTSSWANERSSTCSTDSTDDSTSTSTPVTTTQMWVRLYYPTHQAPSRGTWPPYLDPGTAVEYCRHSMRFGAPPPLKKAGWMLHTWRLIRLYVTGQGPPLLPSASGPDQEPSPRFPVVVYSHGLGGSAQVYTYQTMRLASQGLVVLALNHYDGSSLILPRNERRSTMVTMDYSVFELLKQDTDHDYIRARRAGTEHRVQEFLAATEALHKLHHNSPEIRLPGGLSLVRRLQLEQTFFMGHSFGGATALTAAIRRPDLVHGVIAHDPAIDWMPDDARWALFPPDRCRDELSYRGGTGGLQTQPSVGAAAKDSANLTIHDREILAVYSDEWSQKGWGEYRRLEGMKKLGTLGTARGVSTVKKVPGTQHNEFSDTTMLTPVWLARSVGVTGTRNPVETAKEIAAISEKWVAMLLKSE